MKKNKYIFPLLIILLVSSCVRPTAKRQEEQKQAKATVKVDTASQIKPVESILPKNAKVLYEFTMDNGQTRIFYQVKNDACYQLYVVQSGDNSKPGLIETLYDRYHDGDCFYTDGAYDPYLYKISPDKRNLYVVTSIHANSDGWVTEYQLFKIDCNSLKVSMIVDCAAIKAIKDGFMVAKARLTNGNTAKCTADEIWVMHDEFLNWEGKVVSKSSKEYDYDVMEKKYHSSSLEYWKVQNFKIAKKP